MAVNGAGTTAATVETLAAGKAATSAAVTTDNVTTTTTITTVAIAITNTNTTMGAWVSVVYHRLHTPGSIMRP